MADLPAQTLLANRYRLLEVLGRGGMGTVYRCRDESLDTEWALKEMVPPEGRDTDQMIAQFLQEAQILARLRHPGLPRVTDFFEREGRYYLVMDRIHGRTLADLLEERGGPFPTQQAVDWCRQILDILHYLHAQNPPVLFRDLTPANAMVDEHGKVHLIDFGLARSLLPNQGTRPMLRGFGSSGYAPPEQYGQGTTDARSDLYGAAATACHLLTGQAPADAVARLTNGDVGFPGIPAALGTWVTRGMALRPEHRFQTAAQMREALGARTDEPDSLPGERFVDRLEERLTAQGWSIAPPREPFVAVFQKRGLSRVVAYVRLVDRLVEDEIEALAPLTLEIAKQEAVLLPSVSWFLVAGPRCPNPVAVGGAAKGPSSHRRGPRALLIVPVDLERGVSVDAHVPHAFTNSNDLGDLLLNVRIAASLK